MAELVGKEKNPVPDLRLFSRFDLPVNLQWLTGFGVRGEMMSLNEFSAELMLQNMAQQGTKNIHRGLLEHVPLRSPCTSCD